MITKEIYRVSGGGGATRSSGKQACPVAALDYAQRPSGIYLARVFFPRAKKDYSAAHGAFKQDIGHAFGVAQLRRAHRGERPLAAAGMHRHIRRLSAERHLDAVPGEGCLGPVCCAVLFSGHVRMRFIVPWV